MSNSRKNLFRESRQIIIFVPERNLTERSTLPLLLLGRPQTGNHMSSSDLPVSHQGSYLRSSFKRYKSIM